MKSLESHAPGGIVSQTGMAKPTVSAPRRVTFVLVKIESGFAIPPRGTWLPLLRKMKPKQSFTVNTREQCRSVLHCARDNGFQVTTRKISGKHFRIWKIK